MQKILQTLQKANGAMSLGRVLVFLFGIEVLILTPYILIEGKDNSPFTIFLTFFAFLFVSLIFNKMVDSRYLSISVKDSDKK